MTGLPRGWSGHGATCGKWSHKDGLEGGVSGKDGRAPDSRLGLTGMRGTHLPEGSGLSGEVGTSLGVGITSWDWK